MKYVVRKKPTRKKPRTNKQKNLSEGFYCRMYIRDHQSNTVIFVCYNNDTGIAKEMQTEIYGN